MLKPSGSVVRICLPATSNVIVSRFSSGSTLATGLNSLSNTPVVKAQRVRCPDQIVRKVVADAGAVEEGIHPAARAIFVSNTLVVLKPSGFVTRIRFHEASYEKLVRFPA